MRPDKWSMRVLKGSGFKMGLAGLFMSFWLILIAFFIYMGASGEEQQVKNRYRRF